MLRFISQGPLFFTMILQRLEFWPCWSVFVIFFQHFLDRKKAKRPNLAINIISSNKYQNLDQNFTKKIKFFNGLIEILDFKFSFDYLPKFYHQIPNVEKWMARLKTHSERGNFDEKKKKTDQKKSLKSSRITPQAYRALIPIRQLWFCILSSSSHSVFQGFRLNFGERNETTHVYRVT